MFNKKKKKQAEALEQELKLEHTKQALLDKNSRVYGTGKHTGAELYQLLYGYSKYGMEDVTRDSCTYLSSRTLSLTINAFRLEVYTYFTPTLKAQIYEVYGYAKYNTYLVQLTEVQLNNLVDVATPILIDTIAKHTEKIDRELEELSKGTFTAD